MQQLKTLINVPQNQTLKMIYQATRDGFSSNVFHSKCDGVLGTLTVVKSENSNIFGGYTKANWSFIRQYQYDSDTFLFSLINANNTPLTMTISRPEYAIYANPYPIFGFSDLFINGTNGYSDLGANYELPIFLKYGTTSARSFLAGSLYFKVVDIEVFSLPFDRNIIIFLILQNIMYILF